MVAALIVAAGQGTRMGANVDKLFLELDGLPVVAHTWKRFDQHPLVGEIVLAVREGAAPAFVELQRSLELSKPCRIVAGGGTRQASVWNGLAGLSASAELVAIQDGARPCTSQATITGTIEAARLHGAAVVARALTDTIKESADGVHATRTVDRSKLWSVQTPQVFKVAVIRSALAETRKRGIEVTDDTAACELIGQPVVLVASHDPNPKVTVPGDLAYAEFVLRNLQAS